MKSRVLFCNESVEGMARVIMDNAPLIHRELLIQAVPPSDRMRVYICASGHVHLDYHITMTHALYSVLQIFAYTVAYALDNERDIKTQLPLRKSELDQAFDDVSLAIASVNTAWARGFMEVKEDLLRYYDDEIRGVLTTPAPKVTYRDPEAEKTTVTNTAITEEQMEALIERENVFRAIGNCGPGPKGEA